MQEPEKMSREALERENDRLRREMDLFVQRNMELKRENDRLRRELSGSDRWF